MQTVSNEEKFKVYRETLSKYGISSQRYMLIEECGELLNALAKLKRGRNTVDELITELADVSIMVEQMALFYGYDSFIQERSRKIERLKERLKQ